MGKKAIIASLVLVSLLVGMQTVEIVKANPIAHQIPPSSPITDPPKITVESPSNIAYYSQDVLLSFALTGCNRMLPFPNSGPFYHLTSVSYELDGQKQYLGFSAIQDNQTFSELLTGLSNGEHVVTVFVVATSVYATNIVSEGDYNYQYQTNFYHSQASETINFCTVAPSGSTVSPSPTPSPSPMVTILSPQNDTLFNVILDGVNYQLPLVYETNSSLSWVGYSLDGASNVTVTGNSTLRVVGSNGYHTLTVCANDTSGNWATPQTVTYLVNFNPDYTPTPSPSPTQQQIEPSLTPSPTSIAETSNPNLALEIIGLAAIVAIIVIGLLVCFRKRRE